MPLRVMVVDDHAIVRDGLIRILLEEGMQLVGAVSSLAELRALLAAGTEADVVVLDLDLADGAGEDGVELLEGAVGPPAIVIYTMHPDGARATRLLRSGVRAYVDKTRPVEDLIRAIRAAGLGEATITEEQAALLVLPAVPPVRLSPREREVVELLVSGASPSEIAHAMGLAPSTISTHLRNIQDKTATRSLPDLVGYAVRSGLGRVA